MAFGLGREKRTRSPVPRKSLPRAGASLETEFHDRVLDATSWIVIILVAVVFSLWEWVRYWLRLPYAPWVVTILSVALCAFAIWRMWTKVRELPPLQLALRGERAVGEMLETLRASDYRVFHDLPEEDYNIDHVIIGPGGVFSIETKTRSKPFKGEAVVTLDRGSVRVNGIEPDRDPIVQAKAAARRVREILCQQTGSDVSVTPVVIFPGWFVEKPPNSAEVLVFNETYFAKWITGRERKLSEERINQLAWAMDRHLRR